MAGTLKSLAKTVGGYLSFDDTMQERGYKPILIFTTVGDYNDPTSRRVLVDTTPIDIKIKRKIKPGSGIKAIAGVVGTSLYERLSDIGSEIKSSITNTSGIPSKASHPLEGFMADLTVSQGSVQPYSWANVIFQNPIIVSPSGDQFFGTDFLKYGYPAWVQLGYVNNLGDIVGHPFDKNVKDDVPIVFAGLIASLDQELTIQSGDRLLLMIADFRWYFLNFTLGQGTATGGSFEIDALHPLDFTLYEFFKYFLVDGGSTAPKAILNAIGLYKFGGVIEPNLIFDSRVDLAKKPQRSETTIGEPVKTNYLTMLRRIEEIYQVDINWVPVNLETTQIVVSPRLDPFSMAFDAAGKLDPSFDLRIHQAVLGGNVRNWRFGIDAAGSVNRLVIKIVDPDSGEASGSFLLSKTTINEILYDWKDEKVPQSFIKPSKIAGIDDTVITDVIDTSRGANKLLGTIFPVDDDLNKLFGKQTKMIELVISRDALKDTGSGVKLPSGKLIPYPKEALATILRRLHYWGTQGSIMMMGNADVREGDLIEVFDRRPKGTTLLGFQPNVAEQTMTSFIERFKKTIAGGGVPPAPHIKDQHLGLSMFENIYYIWKVRHYLGPQGFWTKVWFMKQRDALGVRKSSIFKTMRERSKQKVDP